MTSVLHKMATSIEMPRKTERIRCQSRTSHTSSEPLTIYTDKAMEFLLFKDFQECINTCETGISHAQRDHCDEDGVTDQIEALAILAIQAYAEMNSWQYVLPFVQQVFGSVENCPQKVIQLCVLLHAKIKEYAKCHALSSVWLKHPNNHKQNGYSDLVSLCIQHVILPQKRGNLIPQYLDSCPGLSEKDKETLLDKYNQTSLRESSGTSEQDSALRNQIQRKTDCNCDSSDGEGKDKLLRFIKSIAARLKLQAGYKTMKVLMAAVFFYLIAIQGNNGDLTSNFGRVGTLFQGLMKILRSIFWPDIAPT